MTALAAGNVAVVTGAARGIGLALSDAFASRGLNLAIADVDRDAIESAREKLSAHGTDVLATVADVSDEEAVFSFAAATFERFGSVDVVCNNAGSANDYLPCWQIESAAWERLISVNVRSVVHGIRAFVPHLVARKSGHVLNTSSMSGLKLGSARNADYALSKHAVVGLTESLSEDLAMHSPGVKATVLCPGFIRTPLSARQADKLSRVLSSEGSSTPRWGTPIEPSVVAESAVRAIEADLLYAVPAERSLEMIQHRFERLLSDLEEQSSWLSEAAEAVPRSSVREAQG